MSGSRGLTDCCQQNQKNFWKQLFLTTLTKLAADINKVLSAGAGWERQCYIIGMKQATKENLANMNKIS